MQESYFIQELCSKTWSKYLAVFLPESCKNIVQETFKMGKKVAKFQSCKIICKKLHCLTARDTQHNLVRSWSTWVTTSPPRCFSTKNHMFGSAHKNDQDGIVRMDIAK